MKHPETERDIDQGSDVPDDSSDVAEVLDDAEVMARHVAAHLQVVMLLTMRLASLQSVSHLDDEEDDSANSASVDHGDTDDDALTNATSTSHFYAGMPDADEEAPEMGDRQDDPTIPDAVVDFDGVPRQYDTLPVEKDAFMQEVIKSGSFQAQKLEPPLIHINRVRATR